MNKIEKVKSRDIPHQAQGVAWRKNPSGVNIGGQNDAIEKLVTTGDMSSTARNPTFLRDRIEAIQKAKQELGIESSAAMPIDPWSAMAIGSGILTGIKTAYDIYQSHKAQKARDKAVGEVNKAVTSAMEALGVGEEGYWNDDLLSTSQEEAKVGQEELLKAKLEKPDEIVSRVTVALDKLLRSRYHYSDPDTMAFYKRVARGLILSLEALYLRSDTKQRTQSFCDNLVEYLKDPSKFPLIHSEDAALDSVHRTLVENWKVPIAYKLPHHELMQKDYRLQIYNAMSKATLEGGQLTGRDPLYLNSDPPKHLEDMVTKFREALVAAFRYESGLSEGPHREKHHWPVVDAVHKILTNSDRIPRRLWDEEEQRNLVRKENNKKRFSEFGKWASSSQDVFKMSEAQLQSCFDQLNPKQIEFLGYLPELGDAGSRNLEVFSQTERYYFKEQLNGWFAALIQFMNFDTNESSERLTEKNTEKGLFFFRYLNDLLEKRVVILPQGENNAEHAVYKNCLSEDNKTAILKVCRRIVHDTENFPSTHRGYEFFASPYLDSVPGQALALYHKLTRCFSNPETGYADVHSLRELVLANAAHNLYPSGQRGETFTSGFLFSGPPGTGKSFFAVALANQLAVPLYVLHDGIVDTKGKNMIVRFNGDDVSLGRFFDGVKANSPCVLLLDDVDKLLPLREVDRIDREDDDEDIDKEEKDGKTQTGKFLPELQNIRGDRGRTKVILIMTTNLPSTTKINLAKLDNAGYSKEGRRALVSHISRAAIRRQRIDHLVFTFHKLFNEQQGEVLAKRFLGPYVDSGRLIPPIDFSKAGKVIMKYAPATTESALDNFMQSHPGQVTQEQLLAELERQESMFEGRADYKLVKYIDSIVTMLTEEGKKALVSELDLDELAIRANGLSREQIKMAISDYTPETLTQENILEAFEKVRELGS